MTTSEKQQRKRSERLKNRRDYRQVLINRQEDTDRKIKGVEAEIRELQEGR